MHPTVKMGKMDKTERNEYRFALKMIINQHISNKIMEMDTIEELNKRSQ